MPVEFDPYLSVKYFFSDAGLRITKSEKAQQKIRTKIQALKIDVFISQV